MGLLSLFKRNEPPPAEPAATPDAVAQARSLARRRLIGATVLLAIGVIGFPLVFETQPRPVRMDIPIEIPRREGAPPLAVPPASSPAAATINPPAEAPPEPDAPAAVSSAPRAAVAKPPITTERAGEQGREVPPPAAPASARPAVPAASRPAAASAPAPKRSDDGARALAILQGQPVGAASAPASAPAAMRIVVQVGAYTDADKLREVRARLERLGYKTYTQVVATDGQQRTRVRIGPFTTKADADKVAARIKSAGLPVAMLSL